MTMISKYGGVLAIVAGVIVVYILLLIFMPVIVDTAGIATTTMNSTSNMSLYPGTIPAVTAAPWALWFAPGVIGIVSVIFVLRRA